MAVSDRVLNSSQELGGDRDDELISWKDCGSSFDVMPISELILCELVSTLSVTG